MSLNSDQSTLVYKIRHTLSHVMAQAVLELYPNAKLAIGPPIETGFYYDFDLGQDESGHPRAFTPEDLTAVEDRMRKIVAKDHPLVYREISEDEARQLFKNQPYKLELIDGLVHGNDAEGEAVEGQHASAVISTYKQDNFEDLCAGPHVEHTGEIPKAFKLLSVAGAYWRGDEHKPMLQRIYGTAWLTEEDLQQHLEAIEEAKLRDHRKLGRELGIFFFDDEVGPGLPLWLPNGTVLIEELEKLAKDVETRAGYQRVKTPHVTKEALFIRSGHLPYYEESMFPPMELEGTVYYVKPMNCPFHHKIFGSQPRSYRDLPVRLAEYGTCYRYEKSGELFGIMRVRSMQMNDAHIYCTEGQFEDEFMAVVRMYQHYFDIFGIDRYVMRFSTHDKKGLGKKYTDDERLWIKTEDMVRRTLINGNVPFVEVAGEAAFYGPKIDVQIWSAIGREFTLATNQVDFCVPARFDLVFTNSENEEETPLCIHRAPLGTHERMLGFLLEHYAGAFPTWLSPNQVVVIPISEQKHGEYGRQVTEKLKAANIRVTLDDSKDRMQAKIRLAQVRKTPYMLVIGDKEIEAGAVAVRLRDGSDLGAVPVDDIIARISQEIASRGR